MKCRLYYSLYQRAYLAEARNETKEYERQMEEIQKHVAKCQQCMATMDTGPLPEELFQAPVRIVP